MTQTKIYLTLIFFTFLLLSCQSENSETDLLFGEGSKEWFIEGPASWKFANGEIVGTSDEGSSFMMTNDQFDDFDLTLEFYPDSTINSGVYIRCEQAQISAEDCLEINIWDLHPTQDNRTGSIVNKAKYLEHVNTINQWNTYRILSKGERTKVWVNEILTADYQDPRLRKGYIAIQAAGKGVIKFRNIQIAKAI